MKNKNKLIKVTVVLLMVILLIGGIYIAYSMHQLSKVRIGKMININFENADADYLQMLLAPENEHDPTNMVTLLDKASVEQVIQYMRDNNVRIVSGQYKIPQTSGYEELINILQFE